ncbi:hypothetical protein I79_008591 [Cricetulus griseus]|uniref:Uncharacterized protein n=1 Tax=Cricetulus griseus TaxID=10029 RepID=G3HDK8_CRIGR|nr:hypothetical protein I79_008591 [Cricetulus griseus]
MPPAVQAKKQQGLSSLDQGREVHSPPYFSSNPSTPEPQWVGEIHNLAGICACFFSGSQDLMQFFPHRGTSEKPGWGLHYLPDRRQAEPQFCSTVTFQVGGSWKPGHKNGGCRLGLGRGPAASPQVRTPNLCGGGGGRRVLEPGLGGERQWQFAGPLT